MTRPARQTPRRSPRDLARTDDRPRLGILHLAALLAALSALVLALWAAPPASAQEILHRGAWVAKGFDIDGSWQIVREGGKTYLVLDDAFNTKSAPDLKIFLSPRAVAQLENRNATEGAVLVAKLKSNRGGQRYELRDDPGRFKSVVIHCEKYSKLWGGADLK